jgi:protein TonB
MVMARRRIVAATDADTVPIARAATTTKSRLRRLKFFLPWALAVLFVTSCAQRQPPTPVSTPPAPAPAPAPPAPAAPSAPAAPAAPSAATTIDGYKREVAGRIHSGSAELVYEGAPPPTLRSIVVVSLVIDSAGSLASVRVVRDNGDDVLSRAALESARRAAPYARPPSRLARGGRLEYLETWLFRDDGRFRLRSLSEAQRDE